MYKLIFIFILFLINIFDISNVFAFGIPKKSIILSVPTEITKGKVISFGWDSIGYEYCQPYTKGDHIKANNGLFWEQSEMKLGANGIYNLIASDEKNVDNDNILIGITCYYKNVHGEYKGNYKAINIKLINEGDEESKYSEKKSIKIDSPMTVIKGNEFEIYWVTKSYVRCLTFGSEVKTSDGKKWNDNLNIGTFGKIKLIGENNKSPTLNNINIGIECYYKEKDNTEKSDSKYVTIELVDKKSNLIGSEIKSKISNAIDKLVIKIDKKYEYNKDKIAYIDLIISKLKVNKNKNYKEIIDYLILELQELRTIYEFNGDDDTLNIF